MMKNEPVGSGQEMGSAASSPSSSSAAPVAGGVRSIGVVAIGRNEGERFRRCVASLLGRVGVIVYVDSGSADDSVAFARGQGVEVVELDMSKPFTAARARNAGFERLKQVMSGVELVQFVDGDCEIAEGWLEAAAAELEARPEVAVVCGRRRERHRDATIYNMLCDMEWDGQAGEVEYAGGDILARAKVIEQIGGYSEEMIAGEDPELCVRVRLAGWKVLRIDQEMTIHDAAMTRFGQWWKRAVRAGHAYAEGCERHGRGPEPMWRREVKSNWRYGLIWPAGAVLLAWPTWGLSLVVMAGIYGLMLARVAMYRRRVFADRWFDAGVYGAACVVSKFAMAAGQVKYWRNRNRTRQIIEYK
jgi:GT2 family glycosyltransferase